MKKDRFQFTVIAALIVFGVLASPLFAQTGKRVALVIGNGAYANSPLAKPARDAGGVAAALSAAGFAPVTLKTDLDFSGMSEALDAFARDAVGAEAAVFYYSGHGAQASDQGRDDNYLIPVDICKAGETATETRVRYRALRVGYISDTLRDARVKASVLILDACRSYPVQRDGKSEVSGLVNRTPPSGTAVLYATRAGEVASSGETGDYSVFTGALIKRLAEPGLDLQTMAVHLVKDVKTLTGNKQSPSLVSELDDFFYFKLSTAPAATPTVPAGMVAIPGGSFTMGSPASEAERYDDEGPQHTVTLSPFYLGKYEVTVEEFRAFVTATAYKTEAERSGGGWIWDGGAWVKKADATWKNPYMKQGDQDPVVLVSWNDAVEYCNWRSQQEGLKAAYKIDGINVTCDWNASGYRLPTEAEWEYACRAGTITPFATGQNITTNQANYHGYFPYNGNVKGEYRGKTVPVGSFSPNAWGLYDMPGNVWEWCWDWYGNYTAGSVSDPRGVASGTARVIRGGGWSVGASGMRSAIRFSGSPDDRGNGFGFRVLRPIVR